jgi:HSP20 family protein
MLHIKRMHVSDKESDNPWLGHLFISLETSGERMYLGRSRVWHPPTDVYETDSHVMVKIEVAGVHEDKLAVRLHGRVLTVCGCRDDPAAKLAYQQMEISYGDFRSEVNLPCDVDEADVRADYDKGFLYIMLPKLQREHKVPVVVVRSDQT